MIIDRPEANKLTGIYRGKVIKHLQHGKLKVFIPSVYPADYENQPDMLPDAEQLTPSFAGSCSGNGLFSYPNIGAVVVCQFFNGDQNYPIVLGCTLGGENSYGQYETIKHIDEAESKKHLITAGNTHIRLHEDGQINAIVTRPYDNDANIDYDAVNKWLANNNTSGTAGIAPLLSNEGFGVTRDVLDKIKNGELSNVNCRFTMNDQNSGVISASVHLYDFGSNRFDQFLSAEQINKLSTINFNKHEDSVELIDNAGRRNSTMESFSDCISSYNETNLRTNEVEQFAYNNKSSAGSVFNRKSHGYITLSGAYNDVINTTHLKTQGQSVIVADNVSNTSDYQMFLDMQKTAADLATVGEDHVLSSNKSQAYKMDQYKEGRRYTQQGYCQDLAQWQYCENTNGEYEQKNDNIAEMTLAAKKNAAYSVKLKQYKQVLAGGSVNVQVNGEYIHDVQLKDGTMTICLTDNISGGKCELTFSKDGIAALESTSMIKIKAPKILIDGQLEVTQPAIFDSIVTVIGILTGQQLIKAGNDVQSRGISLVNHKHISTMAMSPTTIPK